MEKKDVLIVIPARGGSKGIKKKNIYPVNGKPLIEYTIEAAILVDFENDVVVSTDSKEIQEAVRGYGTVVTIDRPEELAGDMASTEGVLLHALNYMKEKYDKDYLYVMTLQPTSPLRKTITINEFYKEFVRNIQDYDAQLTLTEDRSDYWILGEDGRYRRLFPNAPRRRQDRNPIYMENSAIYITEVNSLRATNTVLGHNVNGYIIDVEESIDINDIEDIYYTEFILKNKME